MNKVNDLSSILKKVKIKILTFQTRKNMINYFDNYLEQPEFIQLQEKIKKDIDYKIANNTPFEKERYGDFGYLNILEDKIFSVGCFFVPKGNSIPLHNHEDMIVFSKILSGRVQINSYDKINKDDPPSNPDDKKFEVRLEESKILAEGDISVLTPSKKNIHNVIAFENSVLFDILIPNYGFTECINYNIEFIGEKIYMQPTLY